MEQQQQPRALLLIDMPDDVLVKCLASLPLVDVLKLPPLCRRLWAVVARADSLFEDIVIGSKLGYCTEQFSLQPNNLIRFCQARGAAIRRVEFEAEINICGDFIIEYHPAHTAWPMCMLPYTASLQSFNLQGPFDDAAMALLARCRRLECLSLYVQDDCGLQHLPSLPGTLRSLNITVKTETTALRNVSALTSLTQLFICGACIGFEDCLRPLTALRSFDARRFTTSDEGDVEISALPSSIRHLVLRDEHLFSVPAAVGHCVGLRDLRMSADLVDDDADLEHLSTCTDLRSLSFQWGRIQSAFPSAVLRHTSLRMLSLSRCWAAGATICLPEGITALQRLRLLDLADAEADKVELNSSITALTRLEKFTLAFQSVVVWSRAPAAGGGERCIEVTPVESDVRYNRKHARIDPRKLSWSPVGEQAEAPGEAHQARFDETLLYLERRVLIEIWDTWDPSLDCLPGLRAEVEN